MDLQELKISVESDLNKQIVNSAILLDHLCVLNENSRLVCSYVDPRYMPFYYYLGKYIKPKSMFHIGLELGFADACFLKSCRSIETAGGFQEISRELYSMKLVEKNLRSFYRETFKPKLQLHLGKIEDLDSYLSGQKWDMILVTEEQTYDKVMFYLDMAWKHLSLDGFLVMDSVVTSENARTAWMNFCKIQNREPVLFTTRYGTGLIQR